MPARGLNLREKIWIDYISDVAEFTQMPGFFTFEYSKLAPRTVYPCGVLDLFSWPPL